MNSTYDGRAMLNSMGLLGWDAAKAEEVQALLHGQADSKIVGAPGVPGYAESGGLIGWRSAGVPAGLELARRAGVCLPALGGDGRQSLGGGALAASLPSCDSCGVQPKATPKMFAVYFDGNRSLNFYNRPVVPNEGDVYGGMVATRVFRNIGRAPDEFHAIRQPWKCCAASVNSVSVKDAMAPASTAGWFMGFINMTSCDIARLDTSNVTDMCFMFAKCESLASLDASGLATRNVADMQCMFYGCSRLASLNLSGWNLENVVTDHMFEGCNLLSNELGAGHVRAHFGMR